MPTSVMRNNTIARICRAGAFDTVVAEASAPQCCSPARGQSFDCSVRPLDTAPLIMEMRYSSATSENTAPPSSRVSTDSPPTSIMVRKW